MEDQMMPEPAVLPFAESVSTPPDAPQGEAMVLSDTIPVSKVAPLK